MLTRISEISPSKKENMFHCYKDFSYIILIKQNVRVKNSYVFCVQLHLSTTTLLRIFEELCITDGTICYVAPQGIPFSIIISCNYIFQHNARIN